MKTATFYTHVAVPEVFACRLIGTVYDKASRLLVLCQDEAEMARLSDSLWAQADDSFLAHETWTGDAPFPAHAPIVLTFGGQTLPEQGVPTVALNLATDLCAYPQLARVLEIVGADEAQLAAARGRFAAYRQAGLTLEHYSMQGKA
ncbi:MAG: DNA polymerase III subunit chi [Neisseria sp.]|nr:DNA polymerase III subunit chi [Neisseria sp.]